MWQTGLLTALVLNLFTLATFGWDKWRAGVEGARRVPERRLLTLCLLGGWPAGWLGMSLFRHKTRKRSFQLSMAGITGLWLAGALLYAGS